MYLVDSRTGKEYLDCFSMFASWPVGHNHPKMNDPKFREVPYCFGEIVPFANRFAG